MFRKSCLLLTVFFIGLADAVAENYQGSRFNDLWAELTATPYTELPNYRINRKLFGPSGETNNNQVLLAGKRTLTSREDFYPFVNGQKLFQKNGICLAGEWIIDQPSPYTGQFSQGTRTPVIVRASTALNGTKQNQKRAFGMAIKLFPDGWDNTRVETLNAFVMHSLGGTKTRHVLDLILDNQPKLGSLPPLSQLRTALRLQSDFERADQHISNSKKGTVNYRPVDHLANSGSSVIAPTWIQLRTDNTSRVDAEDFRHELQPRHYPDQQLVWHIAVASGKRESKHSAVWQTVGKLVLTEHAISYNCDHRLHFHHPTYQYEATQ